MTRSAATTLPRAGRGAGVGRAAQQVLLVLLLGTVLGAATSFAQTFLPDALRPFANSASGWTLLTVLAVAACRARSATAAILGAAGFVALVLGYQVTSTLRGFPTSETLFLVAGLVVGPFVGVATSWLRHGGPRAAVGCGALGGIAIGEGVYGLVLISATTGPLYWTLIGAAGLGLLVHTAVRRLHEPRTRILAVVVTLLTAAAFFVSYSALGAVSG